MAAGWQQRLKRVDRRAVLFVLAFMLLGAAMLFHSKAVTPTASLEAENGTLATAACVVNDTTASNSKAVRFAGTTCAGSNPLNLPADPWWGGGNNYYKQFPAADAYGWSDPSFFPVVSFSTNGDHPEQVANMNALNFNTVMAGYVDDTAMKQYHMSALNDGITGTLGSEVVANVLDDEADGRYQAGWDFMTIGNPIENSSCQAHNPARGPDTGCAFTETVFMNSQKNGTSFTNKLPPYTNSLATGGGRFRYNGYTGGLISGETKAATYLNGTLPSSLQINSSITVMVDPSYVGKHFQDFVAADRYWYAFAGLLCTSDYTMQAEYVPAINTTHCPRASAYGRNVDNMRQLDSLDSSFMPVASDVELGCEEVNGAICTSTGGISGALWSNLIHGAMSAFYFPNFGFECDGRTWTFGFNPVIVCDPTTVMGTLLKNLNGQVKALAPVLNTPSLMYNTYLNAPDSNAATIDKSDYLNHGYVESKFNKNLDTMLKYYNGSYYLFAMINVNADPGTFTFTLPSGLTASSVQVLYDNDTMPGTASSRTIPISGGAFSDSFAHEYTSHIYKITPP